MSSGPRAYTIVLDDIICISTVNRQGWFQFYHYDCLEYTIPDSNRILGVEEDCICQACGKWWRIPYKNLIMAVKMRGFE